MCDDVEHAPRRRSVQRPADLVVVEGNLLCDETRGPGPGLPAGQCPAVRTVKGRTVRDHDPLQKLPLVEGDAEEGTVDEPTSAEWVIGEWVTLDRELHPFEALELAMVIEAVKLHVLYGWPRWWAWTFASLVAQIAIGNRGSSGRRACDRRP